MVRSDISALPTGLRSLSLFPRSLGTISILTALSVRGASLSPLSLGWISNDVNYFTETGSSIALQNPGVVVETLWVGFFSVQFYQNVTPSFISMWLEILWQTIQEDRAWP